MCGIAGILGEPRPGDRQAVGAMNEMQNHRGPDAARVQAYNMATLGHTRLSIIDLTDDALQPMASTDGSIALVFNGEIYNYKELRSELADRYRFRTASDTEIIIAAWMTWGEACLHRF